MIDAKDAKKLDDDFAEAITAWGSARETVKTQTTAPLDKGGKIHPELPPEVKARIKQEIRDEFYGPLQAPTAALIQRAEALSVYHGQLRDPEFFVLSARLVPPLPRPDLSQYLTDSAKAEAMRNWKRENAERERDDRLERLTLALTLPKATPEQLIHLTEKATAENRIALIGMIRDEARTRQYSSKRDEDRVRSRVDKAFKEMPPPPEEQKLAELIDAIQHKAAIVRDERRAWRTRDDSKAFDQRNIDHQRELVDKHGQEEGQRLYREEVAARHGVELMKEIMDGPDEPAEEGTVH